MCVEKGDYVFQLSSSLNMMVEKLVPTRFELLKLKQNSWGEQQPLHWLKKKTNT